MKQMLDFLVTNFSFGKMIQKLPIHITLAPTSSKAILIASPSTELAKVDRWARIS